MKRRKVKCFVFSVKEASPLNQEVYLPNTGGWLDLEFAICINCGELYVIDRDNPALSDLTLEDISKQKLCRKCESLLETSLRPYPLNFLTESGEIANFSEPTFIPDDQETKIIEVWELS